MWDDQDFASMLRLAKDVAKHAEDGQGRCLNAQDVAKHALGTHKNKWQISLKNTQTNQEISYQWEDN